MGSDRRVLFALTCLITTFAFYTNAEQYEDEYKELDNHKGATTDNHFVTVTSNGNVMPFHWNPAERGLDEEPIEIIPKKKIVGGRNSNPGAVPYIINIVHKNRIRCGGSVYNSVTILTAAHCFYSRGSKFTESEMSTLIYTAGEFMMDVEEGHEQKRKSVKVVIHPNYTSSYNFFDIAIVTVDKPFEYNEYVQPLPIDRPPVIPEKVGAAHISGWGYTARKKSFENVDMKYYPSKLQEASVRVFQKRECNDMYSDFPDVRALINAGLVCAGQESGDIDSCQGDSGGPLACYNRAKGNRRYLCGLVSTGIGCGVPGFPGLYTRVAEFHDWVISHSGYADKRTTDDARAKI